MYKFYEEEQDHVFESYDGSVRAKKFCQKLQKSAESVINEVKRESVFKEEQEVLDENIDSLQGAITTRAFAKKLEDKRLMQRRSSQDDDYCSTSNTRRNSISSQQSRRKSSFALGATIPNSFFREESTENVQPEENKKDLKYIDEVITDYKKKKEQRRQQEAMQTAKNENEIQHEYANIQKALNRLNRKERKMSIVSKTSTNSGRTTKAKDPNRIRQRTTQGSIFPQSERRLSDISSIKTAIDKAEPAEDLLNVDTLEEKPMEASENVTDIEVITQRLSKTLESIDNSAKLLKTQNLSEKSVTEIVEVTGAANSNLSVIPSRKRSILKQSNEKLGSSKRVSIISEYQSIPIIEKASEITNEDVEQK